MNHTSRHGFRRRVYRFAISQKFCERRCWHSALDVVAAPCAMPFEDFHVRSQAGNHEAHSRYTMKLI